MAAFPRSKDLGQQLLNLKKQLEERRDARSQLQGELKSLQKQLVEDFRVASLDEAQELLDSLEEKIVKMEKEIRVGIEKIEQLMEEED